MVGYPVMPWLWARDLEFSASASTLAIRTCGSEAKSAATFSQVGARLLQSIGPETSWVSQSFQEDDTLS